MPFPHPNGAPLPRTHPHKPEMKKRCCSTRNECFVPLNNMPKGELPNHCCTLHALLYPLLEAVLTPLPSTSSLQFRGSKTISCALPTSQTLPTPFVLGMSPRLEGQKVSSPLSVIPPVRGGWNTAITWHHRRPYSPFSPRALPLDSWIAQLGEGAIALANPSEHSSRVAMHPGVLHKHSRPADKQQTRPRGHIVHRTIASSKRGSAKVLPGLPAGTEGGKSAAQASTTPNHPTRITNMPNRHCRNVKAPGHHYCKQKELQAVMARQTPRTAKERPQDVQQLAIKGPDIWQQKAPTADQGGYLTRGRRGYPDDVLVIFQRYPGNILAISLMLYKSPR